MKILALDCSCPGHGSWAFGEDSAILHSGIFAGKASVDLATALSQVPQLRESVDTILVGVGPGSFSGIRVAAATAQGLALVSKTRVVPIYSTDAIAWAHREKTLLSVLTPARQGECFMTVYSNGKLTAKPTAFPLAEVPSKVPQDCPIIASNPMDGLELQAPSAENLLHAYLNFGTDPTLRLQPVHPEA